MKKGLIIGIIIVIAVIILIGGYFVLNNKATSKGSSSDSKSVIERDLSKLVLSTADFPANENWTLKDRAERGRTDVSEDAKNLGWKGGYLVTYLRGGLSAGNLDYTRVDIWFSQYPYENMTQVLSIPHNSNFSYDPLSNPGIGDKSNAYKVEWADEYSEFNRAYQVQFIKSDIAYTLWMEGTRVDYELLKDLAKKAELKI